MADAFNPGRSYEIGGFNVVRNPSKGWSNGKIGGRIYDPTTKSGYSAWALAQRQAGYRPMPWDMWVKQLQKTKDNNFQWLDSKHTKYSTGTTQQWSKNISEFIQDPAGNTIKNPLWATPTKQGSLYEGQKVTYAKTPSKWSAPIDPALRVETDSEFLLGKNSADTAYNSDVNARQRNLDLTNLNYGESKVKLAQQRTRDLSGIDQRAARAGIAFSQGRLNARNRYDSDFNDRAQQAYASNQQANSQFYNQNIDAAATRRQAIDQVRQNVIGKLTARDEADKIANPQIDWQNPDAKFQSLEQSGKRAGQRYYVDPKTKQKVYG